MTASYIIQGTHEERHREAVRKAEEKRGVWGQARGNLRCGGWALGSQARASGSSHWVVVNLRWDSGLDADPPSNIRVVTSTATHHVRQACDTSLSVFVSRACRSGGCEECVGGGGSSRSLPGGDR